MNGTELVRSMETTDVQEISVSIHRSILSGDHTVVLADVTQIPYRRIHLTVDEARQLAAYLTEQANEADVLNA